MQYHKWSMIIMRAQPFHNWHKAIVDRALATTPRVLLLLGSLAQERTARNPFLFDERRTQIRAVYPYAKRLIIGCVPDYPGDDVNWRLHIEHIFEQITGQERGLLIANAKPGEDYLARIFHDWDKDVTYHNYEISATDIRHMYFGTKSDIYARFVPEPVFKWLDNFRVQDAFQESLRAYQGLSNAS